MTSVRGPVLTGGPGPTSGLRRGPGAPSSAPAQHGLRPGRHRAPRDLGAWTGWPAWSRVVVPALTGVVVAGLVGLAQTGAEGTPDAAPASMAANQIDPLPAGADLAGSAGSAGSASSASSAGSAGSASSLPGLEDSVVAARAAAARAADTAPVAAGGAPDPGLSPEPGLVPDPTPLDPEPDLSADPPRASAAVFARERVQYLHAASLVGTPLRVVGLGDSVPAGSACDCDTYVTLVARGLAARTRQVPVEHNLAESGLTTRDVLYELKDSGLRKEIADADVVVLTVGANDLDPGLITDPQCQPNPVTSCYASSLATQRNRLAAVLAQLRALQAAHGGITVVTGYWNVFLDGAAGAAQGSTYVRQSNRLTQAVDASIAANAAAKGGRYVDLYGPFKARGGSITRLLSADGDHPSAAGHRLIAAVILAALP